MKFIVGKKLSDDIIVLEGENAGIYETNMDFQNEDYEVFGFEDGHIIFESPENPNAIDEIKESFDSAEKVYTKCFRKEGESFNAKGIDDVTLPNGKTVREVIKTTREKRKEK